jgi:hypothetical protein
VEAVMARRWRPRTVVVVMALLVLPVAADGGGPSQKDVLARAGRRVVQYQAELPHLIATETSVQRASSPAGHLVEIQERHLVSELGWVSAGTLPDLVGVRDVVEVDGQPLHGGERLRLQLLLHGSGPTTPASVTQLLNEGARFNLAEGSRNFNLPTVALFFLHPETQSRFKWSRQSPASATTWVITFKEREQPTIIHTGDGVSVFSKGLVEIETATGEVRRTDLTVHIDKLDYTLTTTFGRVASVEMNLPVSLKERYVTPSGTVTGEARYDTYRRFDTSARLVQ